MGWLRAWDDLRIPYISISDAIVLLMIMTADDELVSLEPIGQGVETLECEDCYHAASAHLFRQSYPSMDIQTNERRHSDHTHATSPFIYQIITRRRREIFPDFTAQLERKAWKPMTSSVDNNQLSPFCFHCTGKRNFS